MLSSMKMIAIAIKREGLFHLSTKFPESNANFPGLDNFFVLEKRGKMYIEVIH